VLDWRVSAPDISATIRFRCRDNSRRMFFISPVAAVSAGTSRRRSLDKSDYQAWRAARWRETVRMRVTLASRFRTLTA
jgi:hypothetical protein